MYIMGRYHFTTSAATHTTQQGGVPAVTFTYDLSPMQVSSRILPLPPPLSPSPILTLTTQVIIAEESEAVW